MKTTNNTTEKNVIKAVDNLSRLGLALCFIWLFYQILNTYI
jgi:hypothetical protein